MLCGNCEKVSYCSKACQRNDWKSHKAKCSMVSLTKIEGKGNGLVADKVISPGTVIFSEKPLFMFEHGQEDNLIDIYERFENLSERHQSIIMNLHDPNPQSDNIENNRAIYNVDATLQKKIKMDKLRRVLSSNSISIGNPVLGESKTNSVGVYENFSRINHSCCSNSVSNWKGSSTKLQIIAVRPISKGEEITFDYLGAGSLYDYEERRIRLKARDIDCTCEICILSKKDRMINDQKRAFILSEMDFICSPLITSLNPVDLLMRTATLVKECCLLEKEAKQLLPYAMITCYRAWKKVTKLGLFFKTLEFNENFDEKFYEVFGPKYMEKMHVNAERVAANFGSEILEEIQKT